MLASSAGWIPREAPLYTFASKQLLPVCLVLLLIGTDLGSLARLGPSAIRIMLAGAGGTILGGAAAFFLYHRWLPSGSWGAVGALTGSWIGGSANLLAVKEALGVPDALVGPIILVDAMIAYSWMGLLIAASAWQERWDRSLGLEPLEVAPGFTGRLGRHGGPAELSCEPCLRPERQKRIEKAGAAILLSIVLSLAAQDIAARLPELPGFSASTWTILLVTTAALALSATPLRRLEEAGISKIGTWALYGLLITIGARAHFQAILDAPVFLALGLTWILIHGLCLLAAGWVWRVPLGLMATASQANIGGTVSAPMVGAAYSSELAGVGLLMAVLGNLLGTYLGLLTASLLRAFS